MTMSATGRLPENILHFARALRDAGLPVGPRSVLDAIEAVEATGFSQREDFRAALQAVLITKREHMVVFDQAFDLFWRRRGMVESLIAAMSPAAPGQESKPKPPAAGAARVAEALMKSAKPATPREDLVFDTRFTMSASEVLQGRDFAQMTSGELALAERAIAKLRLPDERLRLRRWRADSRGRRVDPRATLRRSLRSGGASIDLAWRAPAERFAPIVAICDISGSMSDYTRIFLQFLHTLTERRRVSTFLFGTRLTNVTRALRHKDIDEALAQCSLGVKDWSGGTRIAASLHAFNREWSRRVLGQGAIVLLFTDGLEREGLTELSRETERLAKSCRRLIWVNPLLRYAEFEAKASGIRAMLPYVDEFRPIHNLASMAALVEGLREAGPSRAHDPRAWLKRVG